MSAKGNSQSEAEQIDLLRGGAVVSSLAGAFGVSLRETRLTALLGYLIALEPEPFLDLFGFKGEARSVRLENLHEDDRSDILVETASGIGVIEAKIGATDPLAQSKKYGGRWTALLTQHLPSRKRAKLKGVKYLRWQQVADLLDDLSHSRNPKVRFISADLYGYLEEHRMIKQRESVEIYAREINEPTALALFLQARMYGCWYQEGSRMSKALYFAPHFGKSIAEEEPGVHAGISYVARIEHVEVVETWRGLVDTVISVRGKHWWNSYRPEIKPLRKEWDWGEQKKRTFLFLSTPRLAFNPPVQKKRLQKGSGWLSKRFLSFDDLFRAWGC